ncbi:MAG: phosphohistidine phosphatase SixA [Nitrospirae bacterium]|jgi:phosphohistidine phosphatase|nr:phosphohistidine phosphatase SixA [Nitrospirota bacterium]
MFLYLVQHAEAKKEEEDKERPLSEHGLKDITRMAEYASHLNIKLDSIYHSTKLRAKQTAQILFEYLKPIKGLTETTGLSPMDAPEIWHARLKETDENIMLVGHLPHLARLSSLLLTGNAEKIIISFKMAGIVCFKRSDENLWSLQWMLTPEIILSEGRAVNSCDSL